MKKQFLATVLILTFALSLTACSAPAAPMATPAPSAPTAPAPPPAAPVAPVAEAAPPATSAPPSAVLQEPMRRPPTEPVPASNYFMLPTLTPSEAEDRRLSYSVTMQLQTTDFPAGMSALNATVGSLGGYIIRADVRGYDMRNPNATRSADFVFRVPTERLDDLIFVIENNFNIWSLNQEMYELTDWYDDTNWWIYELREEEEYLNRLLETAEGEERAAALHRLTQVRRTLRDLDSVVDSIMSNVIYSTVDIQLFEVMPSYESETNESNIALFAAGGLLVLAVVIVGFVLVAAQKQKNAKPTNIQ